MARPSDSSPLSYVFSRQVDDKIDHCKRLVNSRFGGSENLFRKDLLSHYGCVNAIEFSRQGDLLVSGGDDRRVLLWKVEQAIQGVGKPTVMKAQHVSNIFCLGYDNSKTKIFSAGNDDQVIVHDLQTCDVLSFFLHEKPVYGLSIHPHNDNVFASACDDGRILIYDVRGAGAMETFCLAQYKTPFHSVMFNPVEPRMLATANAKEGVSMWDVRKPLRPVLRYGNESPAQSCMNARFNAAGNRLLALRRRLPPVLYAVDSSSHLCQFDHPGYYNSCTMKTCCFAGDNEEYVLSGSDDFNLYMWKIPSEGVKWVDSAHMVLRGHRSIVNQVRYNQASCVLASSGVEKIIKIWSPFSLGSGCLGGLKRDAGKQERQRRVFTHDEYIGLVLRSGQFMTHDYSHQSTREDPRMMAFFDSLIQREIEGWSSEDMPTASQTPSDSENNPTTGRTYSATDSDGYSTTSGFYFSKQERLFASSSPRSNNMKGYVIIYSFPKYSGEKIDISNTLNGYQYGEYFGASLASCDLNNDDKDDLIVGAPLWTKDMDEGRVYVFIAWENNNFMKKQEIDGNVSGGRFGSSITCLGDIDYDGYNDIMIGAPYEGDSGAIYLYNSNKNGILKCSQKILGSEFSPNICGFGISISKPLDINNDKYLDIAIGAYLSEQVVLLPSIPVVSITTDLVYSEKKLSRDSKFFFIYICNIYDGVYAPKNLNIIRNLEIDPLYGRAMYLKNNTSNFTCILPTILKISERQCDLFKIHLKDNIQNVIDPISLSVVVDFNNTMQESNKSSNIFHRSSVVINKLNSKIKDVIQLPFLLECGTDDICNSDLRISLRTNLTSNNTYIIGSSSNLKLIIDVHNNGEPAYQTQVHIFIPNPLSLVSIPPACMESSWTNKYNLQVICDLGNPLTNATNETMILELDTSKIRFDVKSLELYANVTTQSEEINQLDKNYTMTIYFDIDVDIAIAGKAQDNVYSYFRKDEQNSQNIKFKHIYEVQKFGRSPINEAILMVEIPTYWKNKDYDIELININQTIAHMDGNILKLKINDLDHCKNCKTFKRETINEFIDEFDINNKSVNIYTRNETKIKYEENLTNMEKLVINTPVENRILFINCSNPMIVCKQVECKLNPFTSSLSVAQLIITLDFKLLNIPSFMLENKNIILFASKGTVNITQPSNVIQGSTNKPDTTMIITKFQGSPINERVAVWIVALSIFLGIILLILIILGLIKLGFFHRKRKEQLEALKAISNENNSKIIEIISSEVLDQE
ncbi:integrin alpha-8-like isoform X1 [Vespa velutina]|uniref:integrin alpha-8-like isoform X1 n=1 Tax=Vespa velutina TaxID=202808 RepID=UPI001FB4B288|nr:integrin alpha-8-like isoform X1 [Vespa velutina]XP_047355718.1 integrin alpha-8-like isoform X1 [Vespa velutina]